MKAYDILGRLLRVGDLIAYPGRHGSSMWINVGTIEGFRAYYPYWKDDASLYIRVRRRDTGKLVKVYNICNVVKAR